MLVAAVVVAGIFASALYLGGRGDVTVSVASDGKPVVVKGADGKDGQMVFGGAASETTYWTSGSFSDDLSVGDDLTVTGDETVGGTMTITGTTTMSGDVSGVVRELSSSMNSAATTTACTFLNSSGVTRVITAVGVVDRGTASSLGVVEWQAGTSTASGANGSSAVVFTKAVAAAITRINGGDVITTTSTPQTAYYPWLSGSYFNFISGTTTNAGTCRVSFL